MRIYFYKIIAAILFIALFALGIWLAQNKMLWNDELYSQVKGIEKLSYVQIIAGKIPEGNNSPLFYVLQKALCDVTKFKLPFIWKGEWGIADAQVQVMLRLLPNFFMSLVLAAIFYVFAMEYSLLAGVYAFLTAISTDLVWGYWAEARPYALWCCLSALQALYFLRFVLAEKNGNEKAKQKCWGILGVVHVLLSLTAVFGTVQAFIVSMILFVLYQRKLSQYALMLFVPLLFGFFYFFNAPHYIFGLPPNVMSLIYENISADRLLLVYICGVSAVGYSLWYKKFEDVSVIWRYGLFAGSMLAAAFGIMQCMSLTAETGWKPFLISSRYFIFLTPIGVVAATVLSLEVLKMFRRHRWMMVNMMIVIVGFLILRFFKILAGIFLGLGIC